MINQGGGPADEHGVSASVTAVGSVSNDALLWLLPVALLVAVGAAGYGWWRRQRAASEIREWALLRGFRCWSGRADLAALCAKGPFGRGRARTALSVVEGEYGGVSVRLFTYEYVTGNGRDKRTVHHRVASAQLGLWVPPVELRTENPLTRVWGAVRGDDLDLESHAFNQTYRVDARDRRVAVALLCPTVMEYLLAHKHSWWWYEQGDLLFADVGEWRAAELDRAVAEIVGMARLVPRHVVREFGVGAAGGVP